MLRRSTQRTTAIQGPSASDIEQWLIEHLATALEIEVDEIDVRAPFSNFGLSSREALQITRNLERLIGRPLDPTLLYDYPSIAQLTRYLGAERHPQ
jgi:acyl carrier protein